MEWAEKLKTLCDFSYQHLEWNDRLHVCTWTLPLYPSLLQYQWNFERKMNYELLYSSSSTLHVSWTLHTHELLLEIFRGNRFWIARKDRRELLFRGKSCATALKAKFLWKQNSGGPPVQPNIRFCCSRFTQLRVWTRALEANTFELTSNAYNSWRTKESSNFFPSLLLDLDTHI